MVGDAKNTITVIAAADPPMRLVVRRAPIVSAPIPAIRDPKGTSPEPSMMMPLIFMKISWVDMPVGL